MGRQNELGRKTEKTVCDFFGERKYWAHFLNKGVNGQPVDIIATRKNDIWFVDAKHLEDDKKSFPFSYIEPNQITSMKYLKYIAETNAFLGFVIEWKNNLYFFDFDNFLDIEKQGRKSVKIEFLPRLEELVK